MKKIETYKNKFEQVMNTMSINAQKPRFTSLQGLLPNIHTTTKQQPSANPRGILLCLL